MTTREADYLLAAFMTLLAVLLTPWWVAIPAVLLLGVAATRLARQPPPKGPHR